MTIGPFASSSAMAHGIWMPCSPGSTSASSNSPIRAQLNVSGWGSCAKRLQSALPQGARRTGLRCSRPARKVSYSATA